ncbi:MAG: hypothetical protein HY863_08720 [Chloroflexi bacterium]|nr:hypothetical protein [Chloroflexota bacterium]
MQKRTLTSFYPLILFALFLTGMAIVQFSSRNMPDNDGYYHIKLAYLMRTEGLKPDFPYLPLSILNEKQFYDHHFLFHVALIPFTFGDLRLGAKWAAATFAGLAFLAIWYLFHRQRIPFAWLWSLGLLGVSDAFLYRMSITRAQSLSLAVLALGFLWLLEGKLWRLAFLSFFYVWMYDAFPLLIALGVLHLVAVLLVERRLEYRPLLFIGGGILLGMLINPYFPVNIAFSIQHMLPKLTDTTSVSVGNEWYPYNTNQLLENSLPALVAFTGGILALGLTGRKMNVRSALALLTALLFGLMLFQARRFVEYFPPFALIFAAFTWSPFIVDLKYAAQTQGGSDSPQPASSSLLAGLPVILLAIFVALSAYKSIPAAGKSIQASKPYDLYAGASTWLEQNTPAGSRVFQTDWDDFPRLFFYNTHNTYLAGLDPTFMQLYNSNLYKLWVTITRGDVQEPSRYISSSFGSSYVHTDLNHSDFLNQAANDPGLKEVYRDDQAVIFEVVLPQSD